MVAAVGQAATKLRQRTPEERRRGAGHSARNESPRHTAWIAYQSLVFALWVPSARRRPFSTAVPHASAQPTRASCALGAMSQGSRCVMLEYAIRWSPRLRGVNRK
jgi:hypothetical protein